jgi:energy-coupling factor transporter ATP-binding protein EcfA2
MNDPAPPSSGAIESSTGPRMETAIGQATAQTLNVIGSISQYLPDPARPLKFSIDSAIEVTKERAEATAQLFVAAPDQIDDALAGLEKQRLLLLVGDRGCGKSTMAVYLGTRLAERDRLQGTLFVASLDQKTEIDLCKVATNEKHFAMRTVVFAGAFGLRNHDLLGFFSRSDVLHWEQLTASLRDNHAYLIFTTEPDAIAPFRKQIPDRILREVLPISSELVERGLDLRVNWLQQRGLATEEHLRQIAENRKQLIGNLKTLSRVAQFLEQFIGSRPDLEAALQRFNDIPFWFSKDLVDDVDAWCFASTLALAQTVRPESGIGWYEFERVRRTVTERIKADQELFPRQRRPDTSGEIEPGERSSGQLLSDHSLLLRARAAVTREPSRLGDVVRFIDRSYAATIRRMLGENHRRVLTALIPAVDVLSHTVFFLSVAVSATPVILGTRAAVARVEAGPEDAGRALRHLLLRPAPSILIAAAVIVSCSVVAAWSFGLAVRSAAWPGILIVTFAGTIASIVASRSTNPFVRAIPPIVPLYSPGNIYGVRIFWRELYIARAETSDLRIALIGVSTYTAMALFFAYAAAFVANILSRVASGNVVFEILLLMGGVLVGLDALIPKHSVARPRVLDLEHLQMFESLQTAVHTAGLPAAETLRLALARWIKSDADLPYAVLPEPRAIWKLEELLPVLRIAHAVGEEKTVANWRGAILDALHRVVTNGAVTLNGSRPSLDYSVLAALVIEEARLSSEMPIAPMLDSIEEQLGQWADGKCGASAGAVVCAFRLLAAHDRPLPRGDRMRMRSMMGVEELLGRPIIRKALAEVVAYTDLLEDAVARDRLASIVRSRTWEALQLNPGNDVSLLLDCYLTAVSLGEVDSPHLHIAKLKIGALAEHMATELTKVCSASSHGENLQ